MNKLVQLGLKPFIIPSFGCRYTKPSPSYKLKIEMWKEEEKEDKEEGQRKKAKERRKRRMTRQHNSDRWQQWDLWPMDCRSCFLLLKLGGTCRINDELGH